MSYRRSGGGGDRNRWGGNNNRGGYGGGDSFSNFGESLNRIDWSRHALEPFQKNFYTPNSAVMVRTDAQIDEYRNRHEIKVFGSSVRNSINRPVETFIEANFPKYILEELANAGFKRPTPIQSQGWPMAMSGKDVIGVARTGSGKTLAFLLPAIVHINAQPMLKPKDGPIVLILAPTRELACQIKTEADKFGYTSLIKNTCVYGGAPKRNQAWDLRKGVEIIIATPGRLMDFLQQETTNLRRVTYLVLDEADRMLDMGFEPQIRKILSQVRPDRQTLLWSATWPDDGQVKRLVNEFLSNPVRVTIGSQELSANKDVKQIISIVNGKDDKDERLNQLIRQHAREKILIFSNTKRMCADIAWKLKKMGYRTCAIHGDKKQADREYALDGFRSGQMQIMVATDVASRGLDVQDITVVVNYDFPDGRGGVEDYVHRIGRTGRAGRKGTSYTFFTQDNAKRARELVKILEGANQVVPEDLRMMAVVGFAFGSRGRDRGNMKSSWKKQGGYGGRERDYGGW